MNWLEFWLEAAITFYTLALIGWGLGFFFRILKGKERFNRISWILLFIGFSLTTLALGHRAILAQRAPWSNFHESLLFFSGCNVLMSFILTPGIRRSSVGLLTGILAIIPLAYATWLESDIKPLFPALQSDWLNIHVPLCFLSYGAFSVSFIVGFLYLLFHEFRSMEPKVIQQLDRVGNRAIVIGFIFLTAGIITGAIWANEVWGSYWRWDPKQNWSVVTWIVYAIYLQLRIDKHWSGVRMAWISILGYGCVLFTFLAVSFSLPSLHNYLRQS